MAIHNAWCTKGTAEPRRRKYGCGFLMTEFKNLAVVGQGMYEVLTSLLPAMIHFSTMLTCLVPKLQECYPPPLSLTSNPKCKLKCSIKCKKNKSQWYQNNAPIVKFIILSCYEIKDEKCKKKWNQLQCTGLRTMFNSSTTKVT